MTEMKGSLLEKSTFVENYVYDKTTDYSVVLYLRYIELFVAKNDYSKVIPILRRVAIFKKCCAVAMSKIAIPIGLKITAFPLGILSM